MSISFSYDWGELKEEKVENFGIIFQDFLNTFTRGSTFGNGHALIGKYFCIKREKYRKKIRSEFKNRVSLRRS